MNEYEKAKGIAIKAHEGQTDKVGADYILHPLAVSKLCCSPQAKIAALLHDVVEDTNITLEDLYSEGISADIVVAVDYLTKREGEALDTYLDRVASNDIAIEVKFCDMLHNSNDSRFPDSFDKEEATRIVLRYFGRMKLLFEKVGTKTQLLSASIYNDVKDKINIFIMKSNQSQY